MPTYCAAFHLAKPLTITHFCQRFFKLEARMEQTDGRTGKAVLWFIRTAAQ